MARSRFITTTDYPTLEEYEAVTLDWTPLRELVGMELADWFMAMYVTRIDATTNLWVYRHYVTREYLHLSTDGRAFRYAGTDKKPSRYRQIERAEALADVFTGWQDFEDGPDDPAAFQAELDRAEAYALRGEPFPYSRADADERDEEHRRFRAENPDHDGEPEAPRDDAADAAAA